MLKAIPKTISAIAAAALVAGVITILPGASDEVSASAPLNAGKGDRLDIHVVGADCTQQTWPYIAAACIKDARQPAGRPKAVRVIAIDRVATR